MAFEKHGAQVIPHLKAPQRPRVFDYVDVTVGLKPLIFYFVRGRGEFRVDVAPEDIPNDCQEIGEVIAAIHELNDPAQYYRLADFGYLLQQNLDALGKAFSRSEYGDARSGRKPTLIRL